MQCKIALASHHVVARLRINEFQSRNTFYAHNHSLARSLSHIHILTHTHAGKSQTHASTASKSLDAEKEKIKICNGNCFKRVLHIGIRYYQVWLDDDEDEDDDDGGGGCDGIYRRVSRAIQPHWISTNYTVGLNATRDFRRDNKIKCSPVHSARSVKSCRVISKTSGDGRHHIIVYNTRHNHLENERVIIWWWYRVANQQTTTTTTMNEDGTREEASASYSHTGNRIQKPKLKRKSFFFIWYEIHLIQATHSLSLSHTRARNPADIPDSDASSCRAF